MDLNVTPESSAVYQGSFTTARFSLLKILPRLQAIAVSRRDLLLFALLLILSDLLRQLPQGLIQVPWMRSGEAANQKTNQPGNQQETQSKSLHCQESATPSWQKIQRQCSNDIYMIRASFVWSMVAFTPSSSDSLVLFWIISTQSETNCMHLFFLSKLYIPLYFQIAVVTPFQRA